MRVGNGWTEWRNFLWLTRCGGVRRRSRDLSDLAFHKAMPLNHWDFANLFYKQAGFLWNCEDFLVGVFYKISGNYISGKLVWCAGAVCIDSPFGPIYPLKIHLILTIVICIFNYFFDDPLSIPQLSQLLTIDISFFF